MEITW